MLLLQENITKSFEKGNITCGLYLDLKKAFDTVSLGILLKKLYFIGIKGSLYDILESYLSTRTQRTQINSHLSNEAKVRMGVPQGSILGPLLFILYINDLSNISKEADFYLFADDTAIAIKAPNVDELQAKIYRLLPLVTKWFQANRLSLNTTKTNYQIYSRVLVDDFDIEINESKIMRKKSVKYLGVTIDDNLKWGTHINNISSVISRSLGIMGRAKLFLSSDELKLLYNTLVLPYLNYCAAVWGSNYQTRLDKLIKLQKRAIRIIDKKPYYYPTRELFIKYKILKLPDLVIEQQIIILLGHLNQTLPSPISTMFKHYTPVSTRAVQHYHIPYANTNYRSFSLSITAPKAWNKIVCKLHSDIRNVPRNKCTLKKHVRQYILDRY